MAGMSIDGLSSGLDTTSLVAKLMQVEAIPQAQLINRLSSANQMVSALQAINTKAASLATVAKALAEPKAWQGVSATSSDSTAVSVTASTGAASSALRVDVLALASASTRLTATIAADAAAPGQVQITRGGVTLIDVTPTSGDPREIARAINDAKGGVTAVAIKVGVDSYRLQISSTTTGAASGFDVTGLTAPVQNAGSDAEISLGPGFTVNSASNTFTDLLPGTSLTVSKLATGVAVAVKPDSAEVGTQVSNMVTTLNAVLTDIKFQTVIPATGATLGGKLAGNSTLRGLSQSLLSASSGAVGGVATAVSGIEIQRDGTVKLDQAKFNALLASDPAKAQAVVAGLAASVAAVAESASKAQGGSITGLITNRETQVKDFTAQIESWDVRLDLREAGLKSQFAKLEVALQKMQSQSNWLAGQLAGLASSNG